MNAELEILTILANLKEMHELCKGEGGDKLLAVEILEGDSCVVRYTSTDPSYTAVECHRNLRTGAYE